MRLTQRQDPISVRLDGWRASPDALGAIRPSCRKWSCQRIALAAAMPNRLAA